MQQKLCQYCNTPADLLATKCESCGSALPVSIPRPVARAITAQGRWSFFKTGYITAATSAAFGLIYGFSGGQGMDLKGPVAGIVLFWLMSILPAMLLFSAWKNRRDSMGRFLGLLAITPAVWVSNVLVLFMLATLVNPPQKPPLPIEGIDTGADNNQAADNGVAVGDVSENQ